MKKPLISLALLSLALFPVPAQALGKLTDLFVFSDSLLDSGNAGLFSGGAFPPSPPYASGDGGDNLNRASNGPVAVDYLWKLFNPGDASFLPSRAGGTNYSIFGSTTGLVNNSTVFSPPTQSQPLGNSWQLQTYASQNPSFQPDSSLFVVWLFGNDVFAWINPSNPLHLQTPGTFAGGMPQPAPTSQILIENGIANIRGSIEELAVDGARHFLIPNIPNLGNTPFFSGLPIQASLLNGISRQFNADLEIALNDLQADYPDIEIIPFQTDDLFEEMITDPKAFGLENASTACLMDPTCNPDEWLFWDGNHPTTAGHQVLGRAFFNAVHTPVPGPLPLLGLATAFGWCRRLRKKVASNK